MNKKYYLILIMGILVVINTYFTLGTSINYNLSSINYTNYNITSYSYCYQETANISTSCGGLSTGNYSDSGGWLRINETYDGDYNTHGESNSDGTLLTRYENYKIPVNATNTTKIGIKAGYIALTNYSIPISCWNYGQTINTFIFKQTAFQNTGVNFTTNSSCYNGTNYIIILSTTNSGSAGDSIYDNAVYWNMSNITYYIPISLNYSFSPNLSYLNEPTTISLNTSISDGSITQAILFYNGTNHGVATYSDVGSSRVFSHSILPNVTGNISYYWNISTLQSTGIVFNFTLNSSIQINALNLSVNLFNENNARLNQFNSTALLRNLVTNQQWTLNNNQSNFNFSNLSSGEYYIIVTPSNASYNVKTQYVTINSTNTNVLNIYFDTGLSLYLFNILDYSTLNYLPDATFTIYKNVNGTLIIFGQSISDFNGGVSLYLKTNEQYSFVVTKSGYLTFTGVVSPVTNPYNIYLTPSSTYFTSVFQDVYYLTNAVRSGNDLNISYFISSANGSLQYFSVLYNSTLYQNVTNQPFGSTARISIPLNNNHNFLVTYAFKSTLSDDLITWMVNYYVGNASITEQNFTMSEDLFDDIKNESNNSPIKGFFGIIIILILVIAGYKLSGGSVTASGFGGVVGLGINMYLTLMPRKYLIISLIVLVLLMIADNVGSDN